MAGKCEVCGKTLSFGNNVSFSKKRTNRVFRPNIQKTTIEVKGQPTTISACARCIRTLSKPGRMAAKA
ncbi:MAG TPA: 50S ribosomal protein L28 [Thermomicrobiales bacterium]|nr:50S ribosomal protein L28 [Thermomicrobiales bacterium]